MKLILKIHKNDTAVKKINRPKNAAYQSNSIALSTREEANKTLLHDNLKSLKKKSSVTHNTDNLP